MRMALFVRFALEKSKKGNEIYQHRRRTQDEIDSYSLCDCFSDRVMNDYYMNSSTGLDEARQVMAKLSQDELQRLITNDVELNRLISNLSEVSAFIRSCSSLRRVHS
jgi:hypothetical protein